VVVDNQKDGVSEGEKLRILHVFGTFFGIPKSDNIINPNDGVTLFQAFFKNNPDNSIESILTKKEIIENGTLSKERLKEAIATTPQNTQEKTT
jgi:hypothetical protein